MHVGSILFLFFQLGTFLDILIHLAKQNGGIFKESFRNTSCQFQTT